MPGIINLPQPPNRTPLVDSNGFMTIEWMKWFQTLYLRVGGPKAASNVDFIRTEDSALIAGPLTIGFAAPVLAYTSPTGKMTIIDSVSVHNNVGADRTLSVWMVPVDDAVADKYLIYQNKIVSGSTVTLTSITNLFMGSGATLYMQIDGASGSFNNVNVFGRTAS